MKPSVEKISNTAFLMAWGKSKDPSLSQDPFAPFWLTKEHVKFAEDFAQNTTPLASHLFCLRSWYIIQQLTDFQKEHPNFSLINVGSGITSYPFILSPHVTVYELDQPHVIEYRKQTISEHANKKQLPNRQIQFVSVDLNSGKGVRTFQTLLSKITQPCFVLFEGILTYLDKRIGDSLLQACSDTMPSGSKMLVHVFLEETKISGALNNSLNYLCQRFGIKRLNLTRFSEKDLNDQTGFKRLEHVCYSDIEKMTSKKKPDWKAEDIFDERFFLYEKLCD